VSVIVLSYNWGDEESIIKYGDEERQTVRFPPPVPILHPKGYHLMAPTTLPPVLNLALPIKFRQAQKPPKFMPFFSQVAPTKLISSLNAGYGGILRQKGIGSPCQQHQISVSLVVRKCTQPALQANVWTARTPTSASTVMATFVPGAAFGCELRPCQKKKGSGSKESILKNPKGLTRNRFLSSCQTMAHELISTQFPPHCSDPLNRGYIL
jgi:hypothetical protein